MQAIAIASCWRGLDSRWVRHLHNSGDFRALRRKEILFRYGGAIEAHRRAKWEAEMRRTIAFLELSADGALTPAN
jgi:hypothetical protein